MDISIKITIFVYMKIEKTTYKPIRITDGYVMKKQLHNGFRIVEFYHYEHRGKPISEVRKHTVKKDLPLTDAEDLLYKLESKLNKK